MCLVAVVESWRGRKRRGKSSSGWRSNPRGGQVLSPFFPCPALLWQCRHLPRVGTTPAFPFGRSPGPPRPCTTRHCRPEHCPRRHDATRGYKPCQASLLRQYHATPHCSHSTHARLLACSLRARRANAISGHRHIHSSVAAAPELDPPPFLQGVTARSPVYVPDLSPCPLVCRRSAAAVVVSV